MGSGEALGHIGAERTHNRWVPSSAVPCTGLAGVGQGKVDGRMCSAALDELGEDGCGLWRRSARRHLRRRTRPLSCDVHRSGSRCGDWCIGRVGK